MSDCSRTATLAPGFTGRERDGNDAAAPEHAALESAPTRSGASRIGSIDLLRGLVIILMVLDHVRDYVHAQAFAFDPTDLAQTTPALFATRWITHLCAPTFVFLAGVSIFLQRANGKDPGKLTRFLLTRGLWLIVLELTVIAFGFNWKLPFVFLQVIWAIGAGMLLMAAVAHLPRAVVLALGALIVIGHPLLAGIDAADLGAWSLLWRLGMEPGPVDAVRGGLLLYPVIPWFGVMCLGYGLGFLFAQEPRRRRRNVLFLGLGAIAAFIVLRAATGFGDPSPWQAQHGDAATTALAFINVTKYPPSLLYVLATLGVAMLLLLVIERLAVPAQRVVLTFGRTPLFTYVLHIYVVHALGLAMGVLAGLPPTHYVDFIGDSGRNASAGFGLFAVYAAWLASLLVLYPVCAWFAAVKRRRRDWWLSYL